MLYFYILNMEQPNQEQQARWSEHNNFAKEKKLQPAAPLACLLAIIPEGGELVAADLGCGSGADTFALLARGWHVLAIDQDEKAIASLEQQNEKRLATAVQQFEKLNLPPLDFVNASMALPFCDPAYFGQCWQTIEHALASKKGYFSGHFFGHLDSWANRTGMTFLTRTELMGLFKDFNIIWLDEIEKDGKTLTGVTKHWHLFSVVAQKL